MERVLLADDDEMNLMVTEMVLSEMGYEVKTAANGEDCMPELSIGASWHHERFDGKGYSDRNWDEYRIAVHTVKSKSLTIGAVSLSENAKAMEAAAKEGDSEYIDANHASLISQYRQVTEYIRDAG